MHNMGKPAAPAAQCRSPNGATTGTVRVTTPGGTLLSKGAFQITQ